MLGPTRGQPTSSQQGEVAALTSCRSSLLGLSLLLSARAGLPRCRQAPLRLTSCDMCLQRVALVRSAHSLPPRNKLGGATDRQQPAVILGAHILLSFSTAHAHVPALIDNGL